MSREHWIEQCFQRKYIFITLLCVLTNNSFVRSDPAYFLTRSAMLVNVVLFPILRIESLGNL
jgi:hypothetical protein